MLTKRLKVSVPTDTSKEDKEAERITIVGYDISGSMGGEKAEFQASLIAAFVARALGDRSPSGRHRHRVLLVPFDHEVGAPREIKNVNDAFDLMHNYRRDLAKANGGTDIQKFLLQAMALIAGAQNKRNPFDVANIVLMSDGGAQIDYNELKKAREAIGRTTPLQTMFVAIGETNPDLQRFAEDSIKMGAEKGFYKEFSGNDISKALSEGRKIDAQKYEKYFYSAKQAREIPQAAHGHIAAAHALAKDTLEPAIKTHFAAENYAYWRSRLEKDKKQDDMRLYADRDIENGVHDLRDMMRRFKVFHHAQTLNFIFKNLIERFEEITGVSLKDLSHGEREQMQHLLNNPTGEQSA